MVLLVLIVLGNVSMMQWGTGRLQWLHKENPRHASTSCGTGSPDGPGTVLLHERLWASDLKNKIKI